MAIPRENSRAAEFIAPLREEHMKTHIVRDNFARVIILYEAPANIQHDEACLSTIYNYTNSSNVPADTKEKPATWNGAWDFDIPVYGDVGYTE